MLFGVWFWTIKLDVPKYPYYRPFRVLGFGIFISGILFLTGSIIWVEAQQCTESYQYTLDDDSSRELDIGASFYLILLAGIFITVLGAALLLQIFNMVDIESKYSKGYFIPPQSYFNTYLRRISDASNNGVHTTPGGNVNVVYDSNGMIIPGAAQSQLPPQTNPSIHQQWSLSSQMSSTGTTSITGSAAITTPTNIYGNPGAVPVQVQNQQNHGTQQQHARYGTQQQPISMEHWQKVVTEHHQQQQQQQGTSAVRLSIIDEKSNENASVGNVTDIPPPPSSGNMTVDGVRVDEKKVSETKGGDGNGMEKNKANDRAVEVLVVDNDNDNDNAKDEGVGNVQIGSRESSISNLDSIIRDTLDIKQESDKDKNNDNETNENDDSIVEIN